MNGERIAESVLMSATLALGVVGCPPVDPGDSDAGVTGGRGNAGAGGNGAGGGATVPVCASVASLPSVGTTCTTVGESQCDPSGDRCVCWRGRWYCTTSCASTYPTEPAPDSACIAGAACNYPSGASCSCVNSRWVCIGGDSCPADGIKTGQACNGLTGWWCDYPNSNPAFHMACLCASNSDISTGSTWTCVQSGPCPTTQPPYDLNGTCPGAAICGYGSIYCHCQQSSAPWICGLGTLIIPTETY